MGQQQSQPASEIEPDEPTDEYTKQEITKVVTYNMEVFRVLTRNSASFAASLLPMKSLIAQRIVPFFGEDSCVG